MKHAVNPRGAIMFGTTRLIGIVFLASFSFLPVFSSWGKVPITPVPSGYGHYCSMSYTGTTPWQFKLGQTSNSDPCKDILTAHPNGTIARAGLWMVEGRNNVLIRCDGLPPVPGTGNGDAFINTMVDKAKGNKNCVVTVAPLEIESVPVLPLLVRRFPPVETLAAAQRRDAAGFGRPGASAIMAAGRSAARNGCQSIRFFGWSETNRPCGVWFGRSWVSGVWSPWPLDGIPPGPGPGGCSNGQRPSGSF